MKRYLKKKSGFTLIEVVISIAILAIVSVSIYNGYLILIRQTKAAEVRQTASLEGKKITEEIRSTIEDDKFEIVDGNLNVGEIMFKDIGGIYTRYLDENYHEIDRSLAKYTETITLDETKANAIGSTTSGQVTYIILDKDQTETSLDINYKIYIIKEKINSIIREYIKDEYNEENLESHSEKIILYVYFYQNPDLEDEKIIKIKSWDGTELLEETKTLQDPSISKINVYINFNDYKVIDNVSLRDIEINVYNEISDVPNIYIEKDSSLNAYINPCKGEVNIYDNRAEDIQKAKIGTLYDINVEIKNKDGDILFRGNSKQNIRKDFVAQ